MIIFFGIIAGILLIAHVVVYKTITSVFTITNQTQSIVLKILFSILAFSFIIASSIESKYDSIFSRIFYTVSSIWTGVLFYLFIAGCTYWILRGILSYTHIDTSHIPLGRILLIGAVVISIYGMIQARVIKTTSIQVSLPHIPTEWIGKKAVWISDTHLGSIYGKRFAQKIVDRIKQLQPDILFMGGDVFDGAIQNPQEKIEPFLELSPPWGAYFITGNHEEFSDATVYKDALRATKIYPLINEHINIHGVQLIGVDYRNTTQREQFSKILAEMYIDADKPSILLKHVPFDLDIASQAGISFQISGHTHKGQTFPISLITNLVYKGFDYGLRIFENMYVYTSSGVGTWGPPMRVSTPAEIVLIEFK